MIRWFVFAAVAFLTAKMLRAVIAAAKDYLSESWTLALFVLAFAVIAAFYVFLIIGIVKVFYHCGITW